MTVQELFAKSETGTFTFEQFQAAMQNNGVKFVDLSEGKYVSKNKYTDDLNAKNSEIETLNGTITARDTDLANLRTQLENAGADATKLGQVSASLQELQTKYDNDMQAYKAQIAKQAYEFAVKEFASTKNFTSQAAKRDFVQSMIAKNLQLDNDKIIGAEDFVKSYTQDNQDAFVSEQPAPQQSQNPVPTFVNPTQGGVPQPETGFKFNFTGVRPIPKNS